ncbi:T9SS type A sorting domain-containing protein [Fulvivirga sp. M361]|uniref:T9SS type A sorting domain-containing protein n=1 Tax=Fulvivirga sp. M361 TaxID=2594266 RepID=UPI0016252BB1|nr:T9SS type A sorting domain-containing protein [Fulvivirga sp. M361]
MLSFPGFGQSVGEVMFVGFNADANDGFSFVTFVPLPDGTTIFITDNDWDGVSAFSTGEGAITWQNNTGNTISSGTVITVNDINGAITTNLGNSVESDPGFDIDVSSETLYMFLGSDDSTPTTFLSAIANNTFGTAPLITNTGLTAGVNAIQITGDNDVMLYSGSTLCTSTLSDCATAISTSANWTTADGAGDESVGVFPDDVTTDFYGLVFQPVTYYSRNATSGGNWDDPNSWTTLSDGSGGPLATGMYPASSDNVVILSGHTITINAITDNRGAGISPDGLGRTNVGPFVASNLNMFYQTGDVLVEGLLSVTGIEMMVEGFTQIETGGSFTLNSSLVNLGYLEANAGSSISSADDLVLAGNSVTVINTGSISNDDLIISFTDATLCGTGTTTLQNGSGSQITFANSGSINQICTSFTVACTGTGCTGFPVVGSGSFISGNTGPAGVGDSNNNQFWVRANDLSLSNGASVSAWSDVSGNALSATQGSLSSRPTFNTNVVNSLPALSFDGGDALSLGDVLDVTPGTDSWSFFSTFNVNTNNEGTLLSRSTASDRQYQFYVENNNFNFYSGGDLSQGTATATGSWAIGSAITSASSKNSWVSAASDVTGGTVGTTTSTVDVLIGARFLDDGVNSTFRLDGEIAEIIFYNVEINEAQRIIIDNYLAAKYDINISASGNDVYTMDDNGNGDFDFDVAGIGQASDGSRHRDASGPGQIRVFNPSSLDNGDFLMWGHQNGALDGTSGDVDGAVIEERLERIWRFSETGDVGTVSLSFDLSDLASPLGSNLRLLIDRNGNGFADNDVTPVDGSVVGNTLVFSGVSITNGDRITIGNTNVSMPLPVELLSFKATAEQNDVMVSWTTSSETNNDFFTVERSMDAIRWEKLETVKGAGNSLSTLDYQTMDTSPYFGRSYYRLKQTDFDGQFSYSEIAQVSRFNDKDIKVVPNPSSGIYYIRDKTIASQQVRLLNLQGKMLNVSVTLNNIGTKIDASNIPNGIYILHVSDGTGSAAFRLIKN